MARREPQPFTLPHFRRWARLLVLDNGENWTLEPFQEAFVRDLFTKRPENWLILPEGNAKTTLIAGLGLYHLQFTDDADVAAAAASRDQASIMYRQAEAFVHRSELKGFKCQEGFRRIRYDERRSRLQIFAADDRTGDGIIPTLCLIDELHRHRDLRLYQTWRGKLEKRNAQLITISTSGEPGSEFEQTRERIRQDAAATLQRKATFLRAVTPQIVLHEWAVPEDGDVEDLKLVKKANPLKAVTIGKLRSKLQAPTMTMTHWRRFVCNVPTRSDAAAITEALWESAKTDEQIPENTPIWVGMDVGWQWDTTAIVPFWQRDNEFRLLGPAKILTPPRDGQMLDVEKVKAALHELNARNAINTVVMDPARAADIAQWIEDTFGATIIARGQSAPLAVVDYERFMEGLRNGWLKHSGDEGLSRHALNAIARIDRYGATRFDRPVPTRNVAAAQDRRVIDALTAAAMVHAQGITEAPVSVYEERGMVEIG